jgi:Cu/Ag efflux pump CusA
MPYEYHAEVSGSATVRQADLIRTLAYGAAALVGLLLLLQAAAGSWRRSGLMLMSLPLSVTGGVLIAPAAGGVWNAGSLAGLFAVFALAVRSSILLARRILDAPPGDGTPPAADAALDGAAGGRAAVVDAARDRAAPLLQSVLVTASVLLPAAAFGDAGGLEVLQPLAVTVLGGLVTVVVVQGYVLPALLASTEPQEAERQPAEQQTTGEPAAGRQEAERAGRAQMRAMPPLSKPAAD